MQFQHGRLFNHDADALMGDRTCSKPTGRGEGSDNPTKVYNDRLSRFIKERGDQVEDLAEAAAQSLGDAGKLTDAEKESLKKAAHNGRGCASAPTPSPSATTRTPHSRKRAKQGMVDPQGGGLGGDTGAV